MAEQPLQGSKSRFRPLWKLRPHFRMPSAEAPFVAGGSGMFTGSCPIREHTGDGAYVGRCEFATYDGFCPRHGALEDYPTNDDREVRVEDRRRG